MKVIHLSLLLISPILLNCSGIQVKRARLKLPSGLSEMRKAQKVAIDGFDQKTSIELRSKIASGGLHTLVPVSDASTATILIRGASAVPEYNKDLQSETIEVERKCVKRAKSKGKKTGACLKWQEAYTFERYTLNETCKYTIPTSILNATNGQIVAERAFTETYDKKQVTDKKPPREIGHRLCDSAYRASLERLIGWMTPHYANVELEFMDIPSDIAERAQNTAQMGNIDRAIKLFSDVIANPATEPDDRGKAHYNIALLHSLMEENQQCIEQCQLASPSLGDDEYLMKVLNKCREAE
ncbi:hypothetical protein KKB55_09520 [Myxococcota bacterium]|nr:hypothetical protein [Myxococcota bacterium]MBU1897972.1 hypothetical protein [Myxococcota bacterium]